MFIGYDPDKYICKYIKVDERGQFHCPFKEQAERKEIINELKHERRFIVEPFCPSDVRVENGKKICYIMRR